MKAMQLYRLQELGNRVPPWIVVTSDALQRRIDPGLIEAGEWSQVRSFIHNDTFSPQDRHALETSLSNLELKAERFAVRSSSVNEDTENLAFAGIYETVLGVTMDGLEDAIRAVWASAYADRVFAYASRSGVSAFVPSIAVIIQQMIEPEAAGVAFGVHPVTGHRDTRVINATWGLGQGIVDGSCPSDSYVIQNNTIESTLADKTTAVRWQSSGGIAVRDVEPAYRAQSTLTDDRIHEIVAVLERLAEALGAPQDIEFAIWQDRLWLLQTRPVTALATPTIWDNNNIIDNYPGLTLPLTVSFVRRTYEVGNRQLSSLLGLSDAVIEAHSAQYVDFVQAIRGRLYYNLTNIRTLLGLLPASHLVIRYYDQAIGAQSDDEPTRTGAGDILGAMRVAGSVAMGLVRLRQMREAFAAFIEPTVNEIEQLDYSTMTAKEVVSVYQRLEDEIMANWRAPALNGFLAMIFLGTLRRLTGAWDLNEKRPNAFNELLSGKEESVSAGLISATILLAERARQDADLSALFAATSDEDLHQALAASTHVAFREHVARFLDRYGDRGVSGELKFETPGYRDRPALLYQAIRSHLASESRPTRTRPEGNTTEDMLAELFPKRPLRRAVYARLLRSTQDTLKWREDYRFLRTQVFAFARRVFVILGERLAESGFLLQADDVLWLSMDEVFAAVDEQLDADYARSLVARRRKDYLQYEGERLPERIVFAGPPEAYSPPLPPTGAPKQSFKGVGCCPGVVRARARVITSPDNLKNLQGDILVAVSTGPGWVQYFPTASGIVIERGSLLSHTAIVTREMAIPCVVGARGITAAVQDGDLLQMDGATGEVSILVETQAKDD